MSRIEKYGLISHSYLKGRTRTLNFYRVGDAGKLILVDAPGYGARGKAEWGRLFDEYINTREQYAFPTNYVALNQTLPFSLIRLKRIYILFTARHGLNVYDHGMLAQLSQKLVSPRGTQPFTLQAIITKADQLRPDDLSRSISLIQKDIWKSAPLCLPAIVTSTDMKPPFQIDLVQKNIADACGLNIF
jgi:GTP-binding protein